MDDWVSTCRKVEVAGARCKGGIGILGNGVWIKVLGLHSEWAVFRNVWRDFIKANV